MESPQMYDNNQNNISHEIKKIGLTMAAQNNTAAANANNNNNNNNNTINQNLKQNQLHQMQNGTTNGTNNILQKQQQQVQQQQMLQQQQQQQQMQQHQYSQSDLEELTSQEISLDLAHLIDDQFRNEESLALFSEMVPAVVNGGSNGIVNQTATAAKLLQLQQARLTQRQTPNYSQLAYMPQPVHTGATYSNTSADDTSSSDGTNIKEEPVDPQEIRRLQQLAANGGQFMNANSNGNIYQSSYLTNGNGTSSTGNGTSFTPLTPASVLHHQGLSTHINGNGNVGVPPPAHLSNFKHNKNLLHSRKNSLKNVDKGTEEYRRRRERNNIAVRKSREKAKVRSREVEEKVKALIKEKDVLIRRLEEMTNEIQLHKQLYMHLMNHSNPEINQICRSALNLVNMSNGDHGM